MNTDKHHAATPTQAASEHLPITLRAEEVARILGLSRNTIYKLIGSGELRSVLVGRRRLIPVAECEAFLSRCMQEK